MHACAARGQVFLDLDFTLMEMNPFTLDSAGFPFPLDMRGELDDTAAFKSGKKCAPGGCRHVKMLLSWWSGMYTIIRTDASTLAILQGLLLPIWQRETQGGRLACMHITRWLMTLLHTRSVACRRTGMKSTLPLSCTLHAWHTLHGWGCW